MLSHPKRPAYPSKVDLDRLGIHGQGKKWEIYSIYLLQQKVIVGEIIIQISLYCVMQAIVLFVGIVNQ